MWVGGCLGVGKYVTKENPKSDLDLDLGFVKNRFSSRVDPVFYTLISIDDRSLNI